MNDIELATSSTALTGNSRDNNLPTRGVTLTVVTDVAFISGAGSILTTCTIDDLDSAELTVLTIVRLTRTTPVLLNLFNILPSGLLFGLFERYAVATVEDLCVALYTHDAELNSGSLDPLIAETDCAKEVIEHIEKGNLRQASDALTFSRSIIRIATIEGILSLGNRDYIRFLKRYLKSLSGAVKTSILMTALLHTYVTFNVLAGWLIKTPDNQPFLGGSYKLYVNNVLTSDIAYGRLLAEDMGLAIAAPTELDRFTAAVFNVNSL